MPTVPLTRFEFAILEVCVAHQLACPPRAMTEILFCLDAAGTAIIDFAVGAVNKVNYTQKMLDEMARPGAKVKMLHNHPSEGSLSDSDWRTCLGNPAISEIIAVNGDRTTYRGSVLDAARLDAIVRPLAGGCLWHIADTEVEQTVCSNVGVALNNFDDIILLSRATSDIVNRRLENLGIINYGVSYGASDAALYARSTSASRIAAGHGVAATCIP